MRAGGKEEWEDGEEVRNKWLKNKLKKVQQDWISMKENGRPENIQRNKISQGGGYQNAFF